MKRGILLVAILGSLVLAAPAMGGTPGLPDLTQLVPTDLAGSMLGGIQEQPKPIDVDINIDKDKGLEVSPVWLAIGGVALLVLILLIAMAFRGRETTVVR